MATNPAFEKLVAATPASFSYDFRLRPMPKLSEAVQAGGSLQAIAQAHDLAMQQWSQDAERSINERITQVANKPLPKTAAAPTVTATKATTPTTPVAPSGGVTSVNSKTGAVTLKTDDIPPTSSNKYLNDGTFIDEFNHNGFPRMYVPSGDLVRIPTQKQLIIAANASFPFTVTGTLTIDGRLIILNL